MLVQNKLYDFQLYDCFVKFECGEDCMLFVGVGLFDDEVMMVFQDWIDVCVGDGEVSFLCQLNFGFEEGQIGIVFDGFGGEWWFDGSVYFRLFYMLVGLML